jgi:hypothetical protein
MADRPRLLLLLRSNCDKFRTTPQGLFERLLQRVLLATFSKYALLTTAEAFARRILTSTHLAPSFREPGRDSHPTIFDF